MTITATIKNLEGHTWLAFPNAPHEKWNGINPKRITGMVLEPRMMHVSDGQGSVSMETDPGQTFVLQEVNNNQSLQQFELTDQTVNKLEVLAGFPVLSQSGAVIFERTE